MLNKQKKGLFTGLLKDISDLMGINYYSDIEEIDSNEMGLSIILARFIKKIFLVMSIFGFFFSLFFLNPSPAYQSLIFLFIYFIFSYLEKEFMKVHKNAEKYSAKK